MRFERSTITVRDGTQLAIDLYTPTTSNGPFPVLLEALPYRKDDITASSHTPQYLELASFGKYVVCRLDLRGTGSSQGVATDEYPPSELEDLNDVITWLASQNWSNGRVGMFGYSYSGFNSLQVACTRPPALAAICAIYATDDRYTDDVHYMGGSVKAIDLVDYCHYMTASNLLPPVPSVFGPNWKKEWKFRFENNEPWVLNWLEYQHDGPYWRNGSLRPQYDRISCPTMLVGGWADGYRNNTFRTFSALKCPKQLLIGPWSHSNPATSRPGPHIYIVPKLLDWFDRWLKIDTPHSSQPPIRVFVRHATKPQPDLLMTNGQWRYEDSWPPARLKHEVLTLDSTGIDVHTPRADVGTSSWNSCAGALPWGQPTDQREDDSWSRTYEWDVALNEMEVLGHVKVRLAIAIDRPLGVLSVKLCDVFPDSTSALVARGFLNLSHRRSSTSPTAMPTNEFEEIEIELEATSWVFPVGHKIRIAITGADWPNIWAPPQLFSMQIDRSSVQVTLPTLSGLGVGIPQFAEVKNDQEDDSAPPQWLIEKDILRRKTVARTSYGGPSSIRDQGTATELYSGEVGVSLDDPANSWVKALTRYELAWPQATCLVEARMEITSDEHSFHVQIDVDSKLDQQPFVTKKWSRVIARNLL